MFAHKLDRREDARGFIKLAPLKPNPLKAVEPLNEAARLAPKPTDKVFSYGWGEHGPRFRVNGQMREIDVVNRKVMFEQVPAKKIPLVSDTQEWNILTPPDSSSASNVTRFPGVVYVGQREGCKKFMIGNRVYAVSPDGTSSALKHIIPPETPATTGANPSAAPKTRFILGFTEDSFVCMDDGVLRHYPLPEAPSTHLSGSVPRKTKPRKSGGEILGAMGGGTVFIDQ